MALRSGYSDMYYASALPRLGKAVKAKKAKLKKVKTSKTKVKSMFGKRKGKKKSIY